MVVHRCTHHCTYRGVNGRCMLFISLRKRFTMQFVGWEQSANVRIWRVNNIADWPQSWASIENEQIVVLILHGRHSMEILHGRNRIEIKNDYSKVNTYKSKFMFCYVVISQFITTRFDHKTKVAFIQLWHDSASIRTIGINECAGSFCCG